MLGTVPLLAACSDEERALLDVVQTLWRFDWDRFLLAWCAAFHMLIAVTLFTAPWDQLLSAGTRPVFDIASRYVWGGVFLTVAVALVIHRPQAKWMRALAWMTVLFLGGTWLTAFSLAVLRGQGNAIGVIVWPFLYGPWAIVAYRSLRKR